MPFLWVRRIEQIGAWSDEKVELILRSGRLAAFGYLALAALVAVVLLLPIGAVASTQLFAANAESAAAAPLPETTTFSLLRVTAAGFIAFGALAWLCHGFYRSAFSAPRIVIQNGQLEMTVPKTFGSEHHKTPLTAFIGLAVLPQTTLGGKLSSLYLLHPDRSLSPLLARDIAIPERLVDEIATALGVSTVATALARPESIAAHEPADTVRAAA